MFKAKAYCAILGLALTACGTESDNVGVTVDATPFFELESYFDQEIERLDSLQPVLKKMVVVDGESEEKRIESTNFQKELQIFRRSDINRPAWSDKYKIDSIRQNGRLAAVSYTALDTSLNTRLLRIAFDNGAVDEVQIQNRARSAIATTEQDLVYRPGRSYHIDSKQKTIGSDPREVRINVELVEE